MKTQTVRRILTALLCALLALGCVTAAEAATGSWKYWEYAENGTSATKTEKTCYEATPVSGTVLSDDETTWTSGWYVLDKDVTFNYRINIEDGMWVQLILLDGCTLTATRGINIRSESTLSIYAQSDFNSGHCGQLIANKGRKSGVGIGRGTAGQTGGRVRIHGGVIKAWGGDHDAGIGSGDGKDCIDITIFDGDVEAHGGESAAGIGDGRGANSGSITIYGGNITGTGGHYAAGIGGGNGQGTKPMRGGHHSKPITIYGGRIVALGGDDAAGIGGGEGGNCGTIKIYGGTIERAQGGSNGAGIGNGECESTGDGGTITIYGGTVNAFGGHDGAGIGGGDNGHVDKIEIIGGTIKARGGENGAGIGGGQDESNKEIIIRGGTVTAWGNDGAAIGGGWDGNGGKITITGGNIHAYGDGGSGDEWRGGKGHGAGIGGGGDSGEGGTILITGGEVWAESVRAAGIGGGDSNRDGTVRTGDGADVTITGGHVTAKAIYFGIGTGMENYRWYFKTDNITSARSLTVNGGTVDAWGHVAGFGGDSGTLTVNGGTCNLHCWRDFPDAHFEHPHGYGGLWLMSKDEGRVYVNGGELHVWGGDIGGILLGHESEMVVRGGKVRVETEESIPITNDDQANNGKGPNVSLYGGVIELDITEGLPKTKFIGGLGSKANGRLTLGDNMMVDSNGRVNNYERKELLESKNYMTYCCISPCDHQQFSGYTVTEHTHTKNCNNCYQPSAEAHRFDSNEKCTVCGYQYNGEYKAVIFNSDGGSGEMEPVQVVPGTKLPLPKCAFTAPEGMIFDTWSVKTGDEEPFDVGEGKQITVTADTVVTAKWKNLYTVTFDSDGGTEVKTQIVVEGECAECPDYPTKEGYALRGWRIKEDGETEPVDPETVELYDFAAQVEKNITLAAVWTDQGYVTVDAYGTNMDCTAIIGRPEVLPARNVVPGTKVTLTVSTPEHYHFLGWYRADSVKGNGQVEQYAEKLPDGSETSIVFTVPSNVDQIQIAAVFEIDEEYKNLFKAEIDESIEHGTLSLSGQMEHDDDGNDCPDVDSLVTVNVIAESAKYWPEKVYYTYEYSYSYEGETITETRGLEIDPDENGVYRFIMPACDITLHADFDNKLYPLSTYTTDTECSGPVDCAVSVSPGKLGGYKVRETVTVIAEEEPVGYEFVGWYPVNGISGGIVTSYDAGCLLSADPGYSFAFGSGEMQIVAVYRALDSHSLAVYTTDAACTETVGKYSIYPVQENYLARQSVKVTAAAKPGYAFVGWYPVTGVSDGKVTGFDADRKLSDQLAYTFVFGTEDVQIAAVYKENEKVLVTVVPVNWAEYTKGDDPEIYDHTHVFAVSKGVTLTLTALDADRFLRWEKWIGDEVVVEENVILNYTVEDEVNDVTIRLVNIAQAETPRFPLPDDVNYAVRYLDVTIACDTEGADIYYTTNGTEPTSDSTLYTGPIRITETTVIKAVAVRKNVEGMEDLADSEVAKATYKIVAQEPRVIILQPGAAEGEPVPGDEIYISSDVAGLEKFDENAVENGGFYYRDDDGEGILYCYPDCPYGAPEGFVFTGWKKAGEERIEVAGFLDDGDSCTLTAQWAPNAFGQATLTLPVNLTRIGQSAFAGNLEIQSVYVPDTCMEIEAYAFENCTGLTRIRLPESCTIIDTAFKGCQNLKTVYSPAGGDTETWAKDMGIAFVPVPVE